MLKDVTKQNIDTDFRHDLSSLHVSGSLPSKLYGLPKVHKQQIPMRPVLSTIGSCNHTLAKVLNKYISHAVQNQYTTKDVFQFTSEINAFNHLMSKPFSPWCH